MAQVTPAEISRLIDEQGRALSLYAAQWCDTPEDVVQEAVCALAGLVERPEAPVSWLYAVVRNKARMARRGQRRRQTYEQKAASAEVDWFEPSDEQQLDARTAQAALSRLDEETREIIIAHIWGDLTFQQIAAVVGTSTSTVHRRFVAGLEALRSELGVTWNSEMTARKN